ncbi:hypothetical protein AXY_23150 [Amphibacillus xylanus NBRC 15112]|uniref:Uncharacterized protein n=1 Tax=Amphibacillus xylanus (strain ATCC 51415 / DSM 6626 / JCM 7361 / LMG 17667 / NBRC 15112 / Ep01) TaxID=698758 RepID=K0J4Y6_AMPXN|nr:hypothetical protein AXY_23150 [Amphibacillus xylanus NBRC 15112]
MCDWGAWYIAKSTISSRASELMYQFKPIKLQQCSIKNEYVKVIKKYLASQG